jgi:parallel beta-helix repeat protein
MSHIFYRGIARGIVFQAIGTIISVALPLLGSCTAIAKDIYVATNGSDSNPGTQSQPMASIQNAIYQAVPGDTIYVRQGTYYPSQRIEIYPSGTTANRINVKAYPKESVIIDGSKIQGNNRDIMSITGDYINVEGFEIRNSQKHGIVVWDASDVRVASIKTYNNYEGGINSYYSSNIVMENNIAYRTNLQNKTTGRWSNGIGAGFSQNITIQNNRIYENYGEGIVCFLTKGCTVKKNTLNDNYSVDIYLDQATEAVVDSNYVFNKRLTEFFRDNRPATGIQLANEDHSSTANPLNNITISNNIVTGGWHCFHYGNYQRGGGLKNVSVVNNTCSGSDSHLIQIDQDTGHSNSRFLNNIFVQNSGKSIANVPAINGLTFSNNLWWGGASSPSSALVRSATDILANPSFVKAGGSAAKDYKLNQNSPAINKAQLLSLTQDFFGGLRPTTGNQDIGAHEVGAVVRKLVPKQKVAKQPFQQVRILKPIERANRRASKSMRRSKSWLPTPRNSGY